jgi:D-proline reductase (dithiol) PrdB
VLYTEANEVEPIRYVEALNKHYAAAGNPPYQWTINDRAPLHRLGQPLAGCTVTLLTSGGISACSMPAFNPVARNDHRLDPIDAEIASSDFQIHDAYYDHADADRDINCQFPVDRLRELARGGEIGAVANRFWSGFMGRIYNRSRVLQESAPAFAAELAKDEVDLLIAVPA